MNPESKGNYTSLNDVKTKETKMRQDVTLHIVKQKLETFQSNVMNEVQNKMDDMVEGLVKDIQRHEIQTNDFKDLAMEQYNQIWSNRTISKQNLLETNGTQNGVCNGKSPPSSPAALNGTKPKRNLQVPEKIFMPRESYLTVLLEVKHMRSIYNFFFVILIFMLLNNSLHDYFQDGNIRLGFSTVLVGFGNFHLGFAVWIGMQISVLVLFFVFNIWAKFRFNLETNKPIQRIWNYIFITLFVLFLNIFFYTACVMCPKLDLPLITSCVVMMESIRFVMKMHAFVRTNAAKQLSGKEKIDDDINEENEKLKRPAVPLPKFGNYLYFLFAPTLIYRDIYPRTKRIRWIFALTRLMEVFAIILLLSQVHERHMRPIFIDWCKNSNSLTAKSIVLATFGMMMPGLVTMLTGFYCILHAWMNLGAELMTFADRMFYRDWWTTANYTTYYRHWNIVVHDYLYEYIFRDIYYLTNGSKLIATIIVFTTSAFIHEVILSFGLRFVYPVMVFFFIIVGGVLIVITKRISNTPGNMIIIAGCAMGNGMMMAFYYMEYYARQNCHNVGTNFKDYFIPVSWYCDSKC